MTESKRFTMHKDYGIHDHDKSIIHDVEKFSGILDVINELNELSDENKELKRENVNIMSDLDYYRVKSGSCEEGLFQKDREIAKLKKENKKLKVQCNLLQEQANEFHRGARENANQVGKLEKENKELKKENKQLQQELFESEQECLEIDYDDNPIRRDAKIEMLKEEFKERFGRDFE